MGWRGPQNRLSAEFMPTTSVSMSELLHSSWLARRYTIPPTKPVFRSKNQDMTIKTSPIRLKKLKNMYTKLHVQFQKKVFFLLALEQASHVRTASLLLSSI